jgi:hypothetical protein
MAGDAMAGDVWWTTGTNEAPVSRPGCSPIAGLPARPVLALFGVPPDVAEPVVLMASILGWQVEERCFGPAVSDRLCIAVLPPSHGTMSLLVAWSPDTNLNELISREGLSILDQPPCIMRVERLLQQLGPCTRLAA